MNIVNSPFFKEDSYFQDVRCQNCGYLNISEEKDIKCDYNPENEFHWYIWCRVCGNYSVLKDGIYTLVQTRLLRRVDCFHFRHTCHKKDLGISIDKVQDKCSKHDYCWLYHCKKCHVTGHISNIPLKVLERLGKKIINEEETDEDTCLLT